MSRSRNLKRDDPLSAVLPAPPDIYDRDDQRRLRSELERLFQDATRRRHELLFRSAKDEGIIPGSSTVRSDLVALASDIESDGGGQLVLDRGTWIVDGDFSVDRSVAVIGESSQATTLKGEKSALTSGTATSGGSNTLTDSGQSWTTNEWANEWVEITAGTGSGQIREVLSNTATQLTVDPDWETQPSTDSDYKVYTPSRLVVTGSGNWTHDIGNLLLDGVEIVYGDTNSDNGNGARLYNVESLNTHRCVTYRHNCWLTKILNSELHECTKGVFYDFATAGSNAGAAMRLIGTDVFDAYRCLDIDGLTSDGADIHLVATNLENSATAIYARDFGDGVLHAEGLHLELNDDYALDVTGGTYFLNNIWHFTNTNEIFAKIGTGARVFPLSGRVQWKANQLVELVGGELILNPDQIWPSANFFGTGSVDMAAAASTSGSIRNGISTGSGGAGLYVGVQNSDVTVSGVNATLDTARGYDKNQRIIEFWLEVTATGTDSTLRVDLNPGGVDRVDLVNLGEVLGGGFFRIVYEPGSEMTVTGTIEGDQFYRGTTSDTRDLTANRFIDVVEAGTDAGTMKIYDLYSYVGN